MPTQTQKLKLLISIALLVFLFLIRPKQLNSIPKDDHSVINPSEAVHRELDIEVEKWKRCMQKQVDISTETWYYIRYGTEQCKNESQFASIPIVKQETKNEVQQGVKSYNIFIDTQKDPYIVVTIGNNSDIRSQNKMAQTLPDRAMFYGTHVNQTHVFSDYQKLEAYLKKNRLPEKHVINYIDVSTYLKTHVNEKIIDLLSINEDVSNYEIFKELSRMGEIKKNGQTVCQVKLRLNPPNFAEKQELIDVISAMFRDGRYILLSFHNLELFLVNYENQECREKYLDEYVH